MARLSGPPSSARSALRRPTRKLRTSSWSLWAEAQGLKVQRALQTIPRGIDPTPVRVTPGRQCIHRLHLDTFPPQFQRQIPHFLGRLVRLLDERVFVGRDTDVGVHPSSPRSPLFRGHHLQYRGVFTVPVRDSLHTLFRTAVNAGAGRWQRRKTRCRNLSVTLRAVSHTAIISPVV